MRDLLRAHQPKSGQPSHTLKVREHPQGGPYVQGMIIQFFFQKYLLILLITFPDTFYYYNLQSS